MTEECYITVSPTANSSGNHTLEYIKEVFSPEVGVEDGTLKEPVGLVLDAFLGHFDNKVKAHNANHPFLKWLMMDGGITPKAQLLDVLIKKVFKGFFRDLFEEWPLNALTNPKTGHPLAPSRKLLAQWIVKAWTKVPKEPVRKLWEVCGYKSTEDMSK